MKKLLHKEHPFRIFGFSGTATILALVAVFMGLGPAAAFVAAVLMLIEITFSFENAIINAKVLAKLSRFWQMIFLTVGIAIAIFGMRIIFPIAIVAITASLSWGDVINLALHEPEIYAERLEHAHPTIAAFGGSFLLMLALNFFFDQKRKTMWIAPVEKLLKEVGRPSGTAPIITFAVLAGLAALPANHHVSETLVAGSLGIVIYLVIHGLADYFGELQDRKNGAAVRTGMAAFMSFLYLEVLDASFSFDGVIGAFAITQMVVLIAVGLGVGAIWVRSLTVFMVRRGTLENNQYLEHGAHYTIAVLAAVLLAGIFVEVPELIAGIAGIIFIGAAIISSRQALAAVVHVEK